MPTAAPEVAVIVLPLPATVGVKVGKTVNTPALNAAEVPVAPAVPPKVTVPVNVLGPLLQILLLASSAVILVKLPLIDEPTVAVVITVGFIKNWLTAPGENTMFPLVTGVRAAPLPVFVAVSVMVSAAE